MINKILHKIYMLFVKNKIEIKEFTIICNNCMGGVIYNDLGVEFLSPTINLFIYPSDFIKFCSNLNYYLSLDLKEILQNKYPYPVGYLEDIEIHFMHYKSFYEAKRCWNRRKARVNYSNLFVIMVDRDNCSLKDIENFKKIKYKKIFLTNKVIKDKDIFTIKGFEKESCLGNIIAYDENSRYKRYYEQFDIINFINEK